MDTQTMAAVCFCLMHRCILFSLQCQPAYFTCQTVSNNTMCQTRTHTHTHPHTPHTTTHTTPHRTTTQTQPCAHTHTDMHIWVIGVLRSLLPCKRRSVEHTHA